MSCKYWLMKAEPGSRMVKGHDVKFSVDDFESVKTTPWGGVRNAEARNLMKAMNVGDKVLFYHSNCKNPGIAAFAEVSKQAYPDYTAWNPADPYYDPKTDKTNPKWFMVDVTFVSRAVHFIPLSLFRRIAAAQPTHPPSEVEYIGEEGVKAIKEMTLVNRGRLSVQTVDEATFMLIQQMAETGGWEEADSRPKGRRGKTTPSSAVTEGAEAEDEKSKKTSQEVNARKRKADQLPTGQRRSTRTKQI